MTWTDTGLQPELFALVDRHFACFMERLSGSPSKELALAAALLSRVCREGHTCLDLADPLSALDPGSRASLEKHIPGVEAWVDSLRGLPVVGGPGDYRPLVLDGESRLYLHRIHEDELFLSNRLRELSSQVRPLEVDRLREVLTKTLKGACDEGTVRQKAAVIAALRSSLCVVTGGPGTGKTTLVLRMLALMMENDPGLVVRLAAPTGKAARRISESIDRGIAGLDAPEWVKERIPREAATIHRLVGLGKPWSRAGRRGRLLDADVVVVDEASMADLELMAALARSLKEESRLVLLGDKNQLASVQAGYVLGDICDTGVSHPYSDAFASLVHGATGGHLPGGNAPGIQDSIVELTRTYRFEEGSPIAKVASSVKEGDGVTALGILREPGGANVSWRRLPSPEGLGGLLRDEVIRGYGPFLRERDPVERLRLFDTFRILCAVREGPYGVQALNRIVERVLASEGLIDPVDQFYENRPVLITENDYTVSLFNGEVGVVARGDEGVRVCFPGPRGEARMVSTTRLPAHETAFAMTVHKSQGSEFDHVLVILPDRDIPLLTRELVYTAVTRARLSVTLWGVEEVFVQAVSRATMRVSGLRERLWA